MFIFIPGGMNIVVDVGNTLIKIGLFNGNTLLSVENHDKIEHVVDYINKNKPEHVIIASVGIQEELIVNNISKSINCMTLNANTPVPIKNNYKNPHTLGVDRLASAVGAFTMFPNQNSLAIDIGTCITFDFINSSSEYLGGSISPGIYMKFKALHTFTSRLPLIEPVGEAALIGESTQGSILSGVINGTLAEIEFMIQEYLHIFESLKVIICGGDSKFFETRIKAPIFVVPELVLIGLNRILQHNVSA